MPKFKRYNVITFNNEYGVPTYNLSPNGLGHYLKASEVFKIIDGYERELLALKHEKEELKQELYTAHSNASWDAENRRNEIEKNRHNEWH